MIEGERVKWSRLAVLRTALLTVGGFACLSLAAFLWHVIAGFTALGVALLLIEALTSPERSGGQRG
jgi:hypothetical protein